MVREISAATRQRRAGVRPRIDRGGFYPFARAATTVIARDIVVAAVLEDMLAGRSCVYVDLLGYDEVAHHSGIERFDTLDVLRSIDRQIGRLYRATQLAPRRYHLVCLSDHGQTQGLPFAHRFGETVEELVGRLCGASPEQCRETHQVHGERQRKATRRSAEGWQVGAVLHEASGGGGPIARRLRARVRPRYSRPRPPVGGVRAARAGRQSESDQDQDAAHPVTAAGAVERVAPGVVVVLSGHTAMVSFTDYPGRVELETIERRVPGPAARAGRPRRRRLRAGAQRRVRPGRVRPRRRAAAGRRRAHRRDPLAGYGPHAADLIRRFDGFPNCPDVVINSRYDPATDDASPFEPHVGSHGGMGGPQSRGFLIHPAELPAAGRDRRRRAPAPGAARLVDPPRPPRTGADRRPAASCCRTRATRRLGGRHDTP